MQTKHTPGPWIVTEHTRRPLGLQYHWRIQRTENRDDDILAIVPSEYPGEDAGEEANARLIAEAGTVASETGLTPRQLAEQRQELLEACQKALADASMLMPFLTGPYLSGVKSTVQMLKAVIAKATGGHAKAEGGAR